jgi:hypothetical protein
MFKSRKNIALIWLIFFGLFLFLGLSHIYLSFLDIEVWEESPKFQNIKQGSDPLLQPLIDLVRVYNDFGMTTNLFAGIGLILAALTALFSYRIEAQKFDKKFCAVALIVLLVFFIFLIINPPSKLSPCIGCFEISLSRSKDDCFEKHCFDFPDGKKGVIKDDCNSSGWTVGRYNSKGGIEVYKEFEVKSGDCPIELERRAIGCFTNYCIELDNSTKAIIKKDCISKKFILGEYNSEGKILIHDNYKFKEGDFCSSTVKMEDIMLGAE